MANDIKDSVFKVLAVLIGLRIMEIGIATENVIYTWLGVVMLIFGYLFLLGYGAKRP